MSAIYGNSETGGTDGWKKTRNAFAIVLLVVTAYQMGISQGRYEKKMGEYSALKAQYDRIEAEYSTLKTEYETMQAEYSALRAQYERFQKQETRAVTNQPKR
jgi:predicted  nucleic acid-binding Zn-ribbon protein